MYQTALHFSYNAHVIQCRSRSLSFDNQVALTWFGIIFEAVRRGHLTFCLLWVMFFLIVHPLKSPEVVKHIRTLYKKLYSLKLSIVLVIASPTTPTLAVASLIYLLVISNMTDREWFGAKTFIKFEKNF